MITATTPAAIVHNHDNTRTLSHPGDSTSLAAICRVTMSPKNSTATVTPYATAITSASGATAPTVSGKAGFRCRTRMVRYADVSAPAITELESMRRKRMLR